LIPDPVKEEYLKEKDNRGKKGSKVNKKLKRNYFILCFPIIIEKGLEE